MDMPLAEFNFAALGSGGVVGFVLALVGGGGSIIAVPMMVYVVGVENPHVAIGTSALAVSASAFGNLLPHARAANVKWRCATVFAACGVFGAFIGAHFAKALNGHTLLSFFGLMMVVVGLFMLRDRDEAGDPNVHLSPETARQLLPLLVTIGFGVGVMSGFFGIGGGFLIVPGLMLATGMPLTSAIGTSLVAVSAFGAATAASYAVSGFIDWAIAAEFVLGGVVGSVAGIALGRVLTRRKGALNLMFASLVVTTGVYVFARGIIGDA